MCTGQGASLTIQRRSRPTIIGEQIRADVVGPIKTESLGNARFYVCFKDDLSKFRRIFSLKHKNEVAGCLKQFLNEANTTGDVVKRLRMDGGKEFDCNAVKKIVAKRGIELEITPPYTPELNGVAEQNNHTIVESARLAVNKLSKTLWAEACFTVVYIPNWTGKTPVKDKSPIELWKGREFNDLDHLHIFGTKCYLHIPKQKRKKFDCKSVKGHIVGYINDRDGYCINVSSMNYV